MLRSIQVSVRKANDPVPGNSNGHLVVNVAMTDILPSVTVHVTTPLNQVALNNATCTASPFTTVQESHEGT
ncbi:MAG: hypothetical protein WCQ53_09125 [bacterium]